MNLMICMLMASVLPASTSNLTAKVTAAKAYYDRAEGFACFSGNVAVDDSEYKLHADRAYVLLEGTNQFSRIAALGHVAMTNGTRRAYGERATYYRKSGLVVLLSSDDCPAEVRDVGESGERVLRGKKIKFWTGTKRMEVEEAWISAPRSGMSRVGIEKVLGREE